MVAGVLSVLMLAVSQLCRAGVYAVVLGCLSTTLSTVSAQTWAELQSSYALPTDQWPKPEVDEGKAWQDLSPLPLKNSSLAAQPNDIVWQDVQDPLKVNLGKKLFGDVRLSRNQSISCISCHDPAKSFTDGKSLAVGEDGLMGSRRSMPLFGAVGASQLFWDGRADSLRAQVLQPVHNPREMNFHPNDFLARLNSQDQDAFIAAFGEPASAKSLARALAAYLASIRPPKTRFDEFLATNNPEVLSEDELRGLHLFRTKARCLNCHSGPLLTDQQFHNIGLSFAGRRNQDLGRYEVTRNPKDLALFRTPSLRGVSKAGPWMHNGLFPTLRGVVIMYNAGMPNNVDSTNFPHEVMTSSHIKKLNLSDEEIDMLVKFLEIL